MALPAIINKEAFDKLGELLKAEYAPVEGKPDTYQLQVAEVNGLKLAEVSNLLNALGQERTAREVTERKLKAFGDISPDKAREALASMDALASGQPDQKTQAIVQARESALRREYDTKITGLTDEIKTMTASLEHTLIETAATRAIRDVDPKASVELLMPIVTRNLRVVKTEAGKYETRVVDAAGIARVKDASGAAMTPVDFVAELRQIPVYSGAFGSTGSTGMGTSGGTGSGAAGSGGVLKIDANDIVAVTANLDKLARKEAELVYGNA